MRISSISRATKLFYQEPALLSRYTLNHKMIKNSSTLFTKTVVEVASTYVDRGINTLSVDEAFAKLFAEAKDMEIRKEANSEAV